MATPPKKRRKPGPTPALPMGFSFAPGYGADIPGASGVHHRECHGCLDHPSPWCAACGAPAAYKLPADAHALTLCRACALVMYECFMEAKRERAVHADMARLRRKRVEEAVARKIGASA